MKKDESKYNLRGVSASKEDVHAAVSSLDKGLFPNAFCKIFPDYFSGNPDWCTIVHSDGAGSKSALAYLYWKETGDASVWRGVAQDSIVMNTDDLVCAGATGPFLFSSIINRNKHLIPGSVLNEIIAGTQEFIRKMYRFGIEINYMGGETADLGDVVRTITVDSTISCRLKKSDVIENNIQPGDIIIGLASSGMAIYEDAYNSGIGSNGLTAARHDVLDHSYHEKYPETFDPSTGDDLVYSGSKKVNDVVEDAALNVGLLLLSPTRTYAPVMREVLQSFRKNIRGIIHCSGGGQTKVMHYADKVHIIKDNLFPVPPVFKLIQEESDTPWKEMYQIFNMGHRMEIYASPGVAADIIRIAEDAHIEAKVIGRCEPASQTKLTIIRENEKFEY